MINRDKIARLLSGWAETWGVPGLEDRLTVEFSRRIRTTLGRCYPDRQTLRLADWLREAPAELFEEVLCHEAAHAAVFELYGAGPKPHGPEWRRLLTVAGFEPRVSLPANLLPQSQKQRLARARVYDHRCPVCHAYRVARRPMRRWRCSRCAASGLPGELEITSRRGAGA